MSFLEETFTVKIYVKAILVVRNGSTFNLVPRRLRDSIDTSINPWIITLNELDAFVSHYYPPNGIALTPEIQTILVQMLRVGPENLTEPAPVCSSCRK